MDDDSQSRRSRVLKSILSLAAMGGGMPIVLGIPIEAVGDFEPRDHLEWLRAQRLDEMLAESSRANLLLTAKLGIDTASVFSRQSRTNRCENCAGKRSAEANYCPRCGHRRKR